MLYVRRILAVLALLVSFTLAAQEQLQADLHVTAYGFKSVVRSGEYLYGGFIITNNGPATARGIFIDASSPQISGGSLACGYRNRGELRCSLEDIAPGESHTISLSNFHAPAKAGVVTIAAEISSATPDSDASNNRAAVAIDVLLQVDMQVYVELQPGYQPEGISTMDVAHYNNGYAGDATNVVVTVEFPEDVPILGRTGDERFRCEIERNRAVCRADSLPVTTWADRPRSHFIFRAPPLYGGGTFPIAVSIRADEPDPDPQGDGGTTRAKVYKFFPVTTTADDGTGSLREAILFANEADCRGRCTVGFRIRDPLPESGYFTIRPRSPLPPVRFDGFLSGNAQKDVPGCEGASPRVMIDGSLVSAGDGLVLQGAELVDGLAIGNFPRYGVFADTRAGASLDGVYLGVDASGRTAAPNYRGLVTNNAYVTMTNCVVSGNVRSGIVADAAKLKNNRIGVAADSELPIPNGASGVYLPGKSGSDLSGNVIAHNREFGVAIDAGLRMVTLSKNSIFGNGLGIDYGLDGPSANGSDGERFPNYPVIENASFDAAANHTVITVRITTNAVPQIFGYLPPTTEPSIAYFAELYANSTAAEGQAERYLGQVEARCLFHCAALSATRTLTIDGDLRGQWISAIGKRETNFLYQDLLGTHSSTSETSPPVPVQ